MRRLTAMFCASLIVAGLLLVPMAAGVSAATVSSAGFACDPHGTTGGSPTTTLSSVKIDTTGGGSSLTCLFRGTRLPLSTGGTCSYDSAAFHVDFSRRTLLPVNNNTNLLCSGATITARTDLSITKDDGKTSAVPGSDTTYTITVTNNGPTTVTSVGLSDLAPVALLTPVFGPPSAGAYDPGTGIWSGLSLAAGQSVTITLTGTIDPAATGSLINTATVAPPPGVTDTNTANNSATDSDTLVHTLTTTVSNFNGRDTRTFDVISYGVFECLNLAEDGTTPCTEAVAAGSVVTVDLQDEAFFTYTCPGGSSQDATGTGPYTGQCIVTMDADKSVSAVGDVIQN